MDKKKFSITIITERSCTNVVAIEQHQVERTESEDELLPGNNSLAGKNEKIVDAQVI